MHRVLKVRENDYLFGADNRIREEEGICDSDVIGILSGIISNGKEKTTEGISYRLYTKKMLLTHKMKRFAHKLKKKIKNG